MENQTMPDDTPALTRRKVLGSLGVIGGAAALGGAGTMAGFSDMEEKVAWLTAGKVDLMLDYRATYIPWERFELNPNDELHDGDFTNTEAIHVVDEDGDPADGEVDDMVYVVGQAPDYRDTSLTDPVHGLDVNPAVSGRDWAALTTTVDACAFNNPTDLTANMGDVNKLGGDLDKNTNGFINDAGLQDSVPEAVTVDGTPNVDDSYRPGFVDGEQAMQFDIFDVKPLDEGECTVSLHVCGNPSFLWAKVDYHPEDDRATADAEHDRIEPERPMDTGAGVWEFGELDDFLWVRIWDDTNCNNELDEDEVVLYQGSFRGLIEEMGDGVLLNPIQATLFPGQDTTTDTGDGATENDLPLTENRRFVVGGNPFCDNLNDIGVTLNGEDTTLGELGYDFNEHLSLDESELPDVGGSTTIDGVTILRTAPGCIEYQTDDSVDICAVIMKGGGGPDLPPATAAVYVGDTDQSLEGDLDSTTTEDQLCTVIPGNATEPADISRVDFCVCEVVEDGNGEIPPQEIPLCTVSPCLAYEWFLPQELVDGSNDRGGTPGQGFKQLPSDRTEVTPAGATDPVPVDPAADGNPDSISLADEIAARFGIAVSDIDVNVVQTDSFHFKKKFVAEQCRHHTLETPTNPFNS